LQREICHETACQKYTIYTTAKLVEDFSITPIYSMPYIRRIIRVQERVNCSFPVPVNAFNGFIDIP